VALDAVADAVVDAVEDMVDAMEDMAGLMENDLWSMVHALVSQPMVDAEEDAAEVV